MVVAALVALAIAALRFGADSGPLGGIGERV